MTSAMAAPLASESGGVTLPYSVCLARLGALTMSKNPAL